MTIGSSIIGDCTVGKWEGAYGSLMILTVCGKKLFSILLDVALMLLYLLPEGRSIDDAGLQ